MRYYALLLSMSLLPVVIRSLSTSTPVRKRILSGAQPTGTLHLGNYLGAIRQWVQFQEDYENFFTVVDLHAITVPHNPKQLKEDTMRAVALYLACGIDPERSKVFIQSHVEAHTHATWLLQCATPLNWLERMIQYKEKAKKQGESVGVGLLTYPVLMAADILLYRCDLVPVGEDQRQHLELARDISRRFNDLYCKRKKNKTFKEFEGLIMESGARIMSLQDGTSKMSKSAENDNTRINLLDDADTVNRKIKKMTDKTQEEVLAEVGGMSWGQFKPLLAEAIIEHLRPIRERYDEISADKEYVTTVLREGAEAANAIASQTLESALDAMGFITKRELLGH